MLTEQQIDAELSGREPYHLTRDRWYWFPKGGEDWPDPQADLPAELFERLRCCPPYPTREAAFADLRQAIALTPASE